MNLTPPPGHEEPSSDMRQVARACRDMYVALVQEGFSANEALQILGTVIRSSMGGDR